MKWAFWRRRKPRASGPRRTDAGQGGAVASTAESAVDEAGVRVVHAARIRVRTRRRLIGATALLLGTAVVVPMMLDPTPRPLPDNIPIDIPSERTPFAPRLSLPSYGPGSKGEPSGPGATEGKPPTAGGQQGSKAEEGAPKVQGVDEPPSSAPGVAAPGATEGSPGEPRSVAPGAKERSWFIQAAALSSQGAADHLSERLSKAGMTAFVERAEAGGTVLYRVRIGPFSSRDDAVKARRHLHALGLGSNVVRVEQAER